MKRLLVAVMAVLGGVISYSQTLEEVWQDGLKSFNEKDFHGSITRMNQLLKVIPDYSFALYNKGISRLNLGDLEGACMDFSRAIASGFDKDTKFYEFMCQDEKKYKLLKKQFYNHEEIFPDNGYRPHYTRKDSLRGALRPERTCFDVCFYDLTVRIIPRGKKIAGENRIYFKVIQPTSRIQIDLFPQYTIDGISWNGSPLNYTREFGAVFIDFPAQLNPGEKQIITFKYSGKPQIAENPPWQGGFVWAKDRKRKIWAGVACEQLGASSWWPNKDHLTDKPDSMKINLEVPSKYKAISNGRLRNTTAANKKYTRYEWFVSYPINNYNVTFYMGNYVSYTDTVMLGDKPLTLKYDVLPYNLDEAKEHFTQSKDIVRFYNEAYGPYPFMNDGFGLVESPYEGMEHQTAIAYGHGFRNTPIAGCDSLKYDFIIVHESAHEWWGNSVCAADMADIWIHEGFATYAELMYLEHSCSKEAYLNELRDKMMTIFNFWPMVENYDVNENSFAGNDVYNKGAAMIHCLRCNINNDSLFFDLIRDFNVQHRYQTVTSKDFIRFVNLKTGRDYTPFFDKYLYETRLPVLSYQFTREDDHLILTYKWIDVEDGFEMPFCIRTNNNKAVRLSGTTTEQKATIEDAEWFNFYNEWQDPDGVADNSFTYYRTRWEGDQL
jgi:aminopeptidase N